MRCDNKKGQLTIFIVIGILVVGAIAFYFIFQRGLIPDIGGGKEIEYNSFLEACLEEKIEEAINILLKQGGSINPKLVKKFKFSDENEPQNISYLCYNQNSYDKCINQVPMLTNYIETEIKNYIENDVNKCFDKLEDNLIKQNYEVNKIYEGFEIDLELGKIIFRINGKLDLEKNEEVITYNNIGFIIQSNLYDLILIAHDIVNSESQYCDFNEQSYMMVYPDILIKSFVDSGGTKIYSVKERAFETSFKFAVRGCFIE